MYEFLPSRIDRFFSRDLPTFSRISRTRACARIILVHVDPRPRRDDMEERDKDKREILAELTDDPP